MTAPTCPACHQPLPVEPTTRVATVLAVARQEWTRDVREPPHPGSAERIDAYIRGDQGLTWPSVDLGPDARPDVPYTRNRQFAWCGAFAAFCYGAAGLKRAIRRKSFASTYRLWAWAKGTARWVEPQDLRAGDVVVVGPLGDRDGAHVVLCESVDPDGIVTYEGNAYGPGPSGGRREGVIRHVRPFAAERAEEYRVIFGVRPLPEDYEAA